ncbi:hypothetical protein XFF7766_460012 [Xanthomonas citri pv. fuscans]|nr:hypothetical protein XFF7766_460012 [Xanthomonas citri pv. fuscans]
MNVLVVMAGSGEWGVGSGEWGVGSGEWELGLGLGLGLAKAKTEAWSPACLSRYQHRSELHRRTQRRRCQSPIPNTESRLPAPLAPACVNPVRS